MTLRAQNVKGVTTLNGPLADVLAAVTGAGMLAASLPGEVVVGIPDPVKTPAAAIVSAEPIPAPTASAKRKTAAAATDKGMFTRPNGEQFFPRKITFGDRETTDLQLIRDWVAAGLSPFLVGSPGCGKTAVIEAALHDWDGSNGIETLIGTANTEVSDFRGSYVPQADGTFLWVDGPLTRAARDGKILYVDEIGRIEAKVLTCLYEVMDGRGVMEIPENPSLGTIQVAKGFAVVGSTNPGAIGCVMDEALTSRFMAGVVYTTDFAIAVRHLGVPKEVAALAREMTKQVKAGTAYWSPTMRDLLQWKKIAETSGESAAWQGLVTAAPEEARPDVSTLIGNTLGIKVTATAWEM